MAYASNLDDVFQALSDPTRRGILRLLREHDELATGEIARRFPVSRPAVSRHLRVLVETDLVEREKEGRNQIYRLSAEPLEDATRWLLEYRDLWRHGLANLKRYVEGGDE